MVDRLLERHVGVYIIRACADDSLTSIYQKSDKLLDNVQNQGPRSRERAHTHTHTRARAHKVNFAV